MNLENEFRDWMLKSGKWRADTVASRIASFRAFAEDVEFDEEKKSSVRGLYRRVWGALPEKQPFEIEDPAEYFYYYGFLVDYGRHMKNSKSWEKIATEISSESLEFLKMRLENNHYDCTSVASMYYQFLSGRGEAVDNDEYAENVWLLSWNVANGEWSSFKEALNSIQSASTWNEAWPCEDNHVKNGDRVYLSIVGAPQYNGIFAFGTVVGLPYLAPHWEAERRAKGETVQKVRVTLSEMTDCRKGVVLKPSRLEKELPNQDWKPLKSGVLVKPEYAEPLAARWQHLIDEDESGTFVPEPDSKPELPREMMSRVKATLAVEGFMYPGNLIENFYLSLKSKPFVILAGISGTGKTRLVRHFAAAVGATAENGRYVMIPVRPDWSDSSDLFGHSDLSGKFVPKALLKVVKEASEHPDLPYFVCLDEMNLARVEYYLSDVLSVIETRERQSDGRITSDVLIPASYYGTDTQAQETYGELHLPDNLYLIGTVNMDETTFPFSKKVLDRANTIEFSSVNLMPPEVMPGTPPAAREVENSVFRSDFLRLNQCTEDWDNVQKWCLSLQNINTILEQTNSHVGYRVRDEIVFYLLNNKRAGNLMPEDDALDNEILQKILPRLQGNSQATLTMLVDLFKICLGNHKGIQTENGNVGEEMASLLKHADTKKVPYPKSAAKLIQMVKRFEADGFTSFWL